MPKLREHKKIMDKQLEKDLYFLRVCKEVSKASKCLSRQIGSILVKDGCIISTGYNGPPKGVKHCNERPPSHYCWINETASCQINLWNFKNCPRTNLEFKSGTGLHLCQAAHSERNAIVQAARNGISTLSTTLYCYCPLPCKDCMVEIINAGIIEIVCLEGDDYDKYSRILLNDAKIRIRQIREKELLVKE